jgi:hypothetical protein
VACRVAGTVEELAAADTGLEVPAAAEIPGSP